MTQRVLEHVKQDDFMQRVIMKNSALERFGEPSEVCVYCRKCFCITNRISILQVATMVAFLASNEASFITGQDIKIDGGMTAALPYTPLFADT